MNPEEFHNIYRAEAAFWWYQGMREITRALVDPIILPASVHKGLDVGCGTGFNALEFEFRFGLQMFGIDVDPLAIQYSRQRKFFRTLVASATKLPFSANYFDLVTSFDVLSFLPVGTDEEALKEFVRVVRPGGLLLIRVPALRILRSRHSTWIEEHHRYRAGELLKKISALNCRIHRWTYANTFLVPVALLKFRIWENLQKEKPYSGIEEIPTFWLSRALLGVLKLEATLIRRSFKLPVGQSLMVLAQKLAPP